jgi:hypothetical protein
MAGNSAAVAEMEEAAALMRDAGLEVYATSGWKDRGRSSSVDYRYVIDHHTAATNDITSMLINGRSDLPGPLCNWELQEYGRWGLIASGRANHAGEATVSSSESYGIEATGPQNYPDVYGPAAFPGNYDSYTVGNACILAAMGITDISRLKGHKEIAVPAGRKIDPYTDMNQMRRDTAAGGVEEEDLNTEQHNRLKAIYDGMVVPGTTTVAEAYELLFGRAKTNYYALETKDPAGAPVTPDQTMESLYSQVRTVENQVKALCDAAGVPFELVDTSKY